jgi:hypothetical protein
MPAYLNRNFFLSYCVFTLYLHFVFSNYAFKTIQNKTTLRALVGVHFNHKQEFLLLQHPTDPGDPHGHPCNK